jgi:hypothetical protein
MIIKRCEALLPPLRPDLPAALPLHLSERLIDVELSAREPLRDAREQGAHWLLRPKAGPRHDAPKPCRPW